MEVVTLNDIVRALRKAGLKPGDVVNIHSRLFAIGSVQGVEVRNIPAVYLHAFQQVIGESGTVVVPTYTTSFGRFGTPFVLEESPSEMGVFSEYVRRSYQAIRTLHPIQSLAALGGKAEVLAKDHPRWNVGFDTVWDRMLKHNGKVVSIGILPSRSMSFMHQVEFLACVPYLYHKILRGEVYAEGSRIQDDFLMAARYLQYGIGYDLTQLENDLEAHSAICEVPLGGNALWVVPLQAALEVGIKGLRKDPYYLLKENPSFVFGEIPCDGITIEREERVPRYFLV